MPIVKWVRTMIGNKIKTRRKELNITQEELAKMTGYTTRSTINKIEQGVNDIPLSKVSVFAKALNTTPSYLMGWEEENNNIDIDIDMDMSNNQGTISNNIGADPSESNNTYTTNNYYTSPCSQREKIVNHDVETSITSKELFYELLLTLKDMSDEQLKDMIRYGNFILKG